jgi:hypothetical protein
VTLTDAVYVVGGKGPAGLHHSNGEVCDPCVNLWDDLPEMAARRAYCTVEAIGGSLFCAGTHNGFSSCLNTVERFDPREGAWHMVTPPRQVPQTPMHPNILSSTPLELGTCICACVVDVCVGKGSGCTLVCG